MERIASRKYGLACQVIGSVGAILAAVDPGTAMAQPAAVTSVTVGSDNVVDSGTITATEPGAVALWAESQSDGNCGSNTVNVTGDIIGDRWAIFARGCGVSTVNIDAGNSVQSIGGNTVTLWNIAGTTAVTNIDGVLAAPSDNGIALVVFGTSTETTLGDGAVMRGRFIGGDETDLLTINAGGTWYTGGESDFWTGEDSLFNAGVIAVTSDATMLNLESFTNEGTLLLGENSLSLPDLTSFTNSGTVELTTGSLNLPELLSFVNYGTLAIASGQTAPDAAFRSLVLDEEVDAVVTLPTLTNFGTVTLVNDQAGDVLQIANDYVAGKGSMLLIDVGGGTSDQIVIGGSVTGTTQLFVNKVGALGSAPILVAAAGRADRRAFSIANPAVTRLIDLKLRQSNGQFFLFAAPNATAFQPLAMAGLVKDMWYQSAESYSTFRPRARNLDRRNNAGFALWGQSFAGRNGFESRSTGAGDDRLQVTRYGAQFGIDLPIAVNGVTAGLTSGYQRASGDYRSTPGAAIVTGFNVGGYVQFVSSGGAYGGALVKMDRNEGRLSNQAFALADDHKSTVAGIKGEVGYRWSAGSTHLNVEGGLSAIRTMIDGFAVEGVAYSFHRSTTARASLAARAQFSGPLVPFVEARLSHEFGDSARMAMNASDDADDVRLPARGTSARLEAGVGHGRSGPSLAGWIEAGKVRGMGLSVDIGF